MSRDKAPVLGFIDHHRQHYADRVRVAEEGEFLIGEHLADDSLGPGGEFRVELVELGMCGSGPALHPRLVCFGDGVESLRGAIEAGLLDALRPVRGQGAVRATSDRDRDGRPIRPTTIGDDGEG